MEITVKDCSVLDASGDEAGKSIPNQPNDEAPELGGHVPEIVKVVVASMVESQTAIWVLGSSFVGGCVSVLSRSGFR